MCIRDRPIQGRRFQFSAQRRRRKADRHIAIQIAVFAGENGMRLDPNLHIQIARRPALLTGLAFPGQADTVAVVNPGRYFDRQGFLLLDPALSLIHI